MDFKSDHSALPAKRAETSNHHRDDLLTDKELLSPTGLGASFWRSRRLKGDGPVYIKISSRAVRYRWGDVLDWIETLKRSSTSDQGDAA
jgi:predicted DNA-binding transcriptional regulator AlpA